MEYDEFVHLLDNIDFSKKYIQKYYVFCYINNNNNIEYNILL